ncbi:pentatricopeptide repeat-containing protein At2g36730-like [Salvia splendens]|uniref:pentatricopeptide repeat-containing protein At2g36730-like n=1 Tax=Salvia splendens TaxID=180675 RepID=UPI001C2526CE|nr:pentatricopeptide repeat-containing protein At2g36730-like [Salvia splendens]
MFFLINLLNNEINLNRNSIDETFTHSHCNLPMISRHIQSLFQLSKTSAKTLQILHCILLKSSLDYDEYFFSQLMLSAASASASIHHARRLFDSSPIAPPPLFAWNMLIKAYSKSSTPIEAVTLFSELLRTPGSLRPNQFTFPFVVKACGSGSMLGAGGSVHSFAVEAGFASDPHVKNTLLTMYAGFGLIEFARKMFDEMPERSVVSWSSMIAAYVHCNLELDALGAFKEMTMANENPNSVTLITLLSACTKLLNTRLSKSIHTHILINAINLDVALGTALLSTYAKSGHIDEALRVFNSITLKNLQSWTVMISSLANNGRGEEALSLFATMEQTGLKPDSVSFSAALSACSHRGLVSKGKELFEKMVNVYKIKPSVEHYGCMVDLLGRGGETGEAYRVIKSMPMEPNSVILRSYLSACKEHGCVHGLDERLVERLIELESGVGANYVLASSVLVGGKDDMRREMKKKGVEKVAGFSWVEAIPLANEIVM